jgi:adenylate cyclase
VLDRRADDDEERQNADRTSDDERDSRDGAGGTFSYRGFSFGTFTNEATHPRQATEARNNETMRDSLRSFLRDAGAPDADVARAESEDWLPLLVLDRLLLPGQAEYDLNSFAQASALDESYLRRLWHALGFPDVPDDAQVFTERDLQAARRLVERGDADALDRDAVVRQVQAVSAAMARIASVEADAIGDALERLRGQGLSSEQFACALFQSDRWDDLNLLIDYEHRLQLRAAIWRRLALDAAPEIAIGVGFADLAGYTNATARLDSAEIGALVARWEDRAYDTMTEHGARVVKTIGDEVMFVGLPQQVVDAALALRDVARADDTMLPVRVGVAAGPVVSRNGDFYGPVVNLASRLTDIARAGQVLATDALREELDGDALSWVSIGAQRLRGIGAVETFALERAR